MTTRKRPNLPTRDKCCGCAACYDACPHSAITMTEDKNGFLYPNVDEDICVGCGLCVAKCHIANLKLIQRHKIGQPLKAWTTDQELIKNSASGGVFAQLATDFLSVGGAVVGAKLEGKCDVRHVVIKSVSELQSLQNSKYRQSIASGIYAEAQQLLRKGVDVLFSGTPCMVAALQHFLGNRDKYEGKLLTIEIICHGVPSSELIKQALHYHNADSVVRFRTKSMGWLMGNRVVYEKNGKTEERKDRCEDYFFRMYLSMSFLRNNCYECPYANIERVADITIGDFWEKTYGKIDNHDGVSVVSVNSKVGMKYIMQSKMLHTEPVEWRACLPANINLYMPTNNNLVRLGKYIHILKKLPQCIRINAFLCGFRSRLLYKYQMKFVWLITPKLLAKKIVKQQQKLHEVLRMAKEKD